MNLNKYRYLCKREKSIRDDLELAKAQAATLEQELLFVQKWKSDLNENDEQIPDVLLNDQFQSIKDIQSIVCEVCGTTMIDMLSHKRSQSITKPRQIAMYLCRELTVYSLPELGDAFDGKDHTTVIRACRNVEKMIVEKKDLREMIEKIKMLLKYRENNY